MSVYLGIVEDMLAPWVSDFNQDKITTRAGTIGDAMKLYRLPKESFRIENKQYLVYAWVNIKDPWYRDIGEGFLFIGRVPEASHRDGWSYFESRPIQTDDSKKNYIKVRT
jgi:hypothetical protein